MSTVQKFEDLEVRQIARILYRKISKLSAKLRVAKEFRFAEQIKAASGSIMDNIAEGFERNSRLEFINSLGVAKGETGELKSQLYRSIDDGYLTEEEFSELYENTDIAARKIANFIIYLNECETKGLKFKNRSSDKSSTVRLDKPNDKP